MSIRLTNRRVFLGAGLLFLATAGLLIVARKPFRLTNELPIEDFLQRSTLEEKIGQLMIVGFDGSEIHPQLRTALEKYRVGGVVLFSPNVRSPGQLAKLNNDIQALAAHTGLPGLFIAVDQEGGLVSRLTEEKGFTEFPGAMAISATSPDAKAVETAHRVGSMMATELRAVGINMNFAPDLDVSLTPRNGAVGCRSFGSDPSRVAALGAALIQGLQGQGVMAVAKHFPGQGSADADSHYVMPRVARSKSQLEESELVPFRAAISGGVSGLMAAHAVFPAVDEDAGVPASLSQRTLTALLRERLRFDGVIVSDSLEMAGLRRAGYTIPEAAALAINAGADLLLFGRDLGAQHQAYEYLLQQAKSGGIAESRIDDAVRRVLRAKKKFGVIAPAPVDASVAAKICAADATREEVQQITRAAITVVQDPAKILPLSSDSKLVLVSVPRGQWLAAKLTGLLAYVPVKELVDPSERADALRTVAENPDAIVVVATSNAMNLRRQEELIQAIAKLNRRTLIIALRDPQDLGLMTNSENVSRGPTLVATYGGGASAHEALLGALYGRFPATGWLPIRLPSPPNPSAAR